MLPRRSALQAPRATGGYLRSASTQRSGFLTLVDIGPTILDTLGLERPVDMEGRPAEVVGSGASLEARVDRLISLNAASRFRERLLVPTTSVVVLLLLVLVVLRHHTTSAAAGVGTASGVPASGRTAIVGVVHHHVTVTLT